MGQPYIVANAKGVNRILRILQYTLVPVARLNAVSVAAFVVNLARYVCDVHNEREILFPLVIRAMSRSRVAVPITALRMH
jgi:hypothetical protein